MKRIGCDHAKRLCEAWLTQHAFLGIQPKTPDGHRWVQVKTKNVSHGLFKKDVCPVCADEMIYVRIICRRWVEETHTLTDAPRKLPILVETPDRCFVLDGEKFNMPKSPEFGVCTNFLHEVVRFGAYRVKAVLLGFEDIFQQFDTEQQRWIRRMPCTSR